MVPKITEIASGYLPQVLKYLEKNKLLALATVSGDTPWIANVFFAYDKNCNLFIFSKEDTRHSGYIKENARVAVGIHQFWGKSFSVKGLQLIGRANKVNKKEFTRFFPIYLRRYPWAVRFLKDHVLYKIESKEIYYIDQELFGHFNRVRIK